MLNKIFLHLCLELYFVNLPKHVHVAAIVVFIDEFFDYIPGAEVVIGEVYKITVTKCFSFWIRLYDVGEIFIPQKLRGIIKIKLSRSDDSRVRNFSSLLALGCFGGQRCFLIERY